MKPLGSKPLKSHSVSVPAVNVGRPESRAKTTLGMFGARSVELRKDPGQVYRELISNAKGENVKPRGWLMQKLFGQTKDAARVQDAKTNLVREIIQLKIEIPPKLEEALLRKNGLSDIEEAQLLELLSKRISSDKQLVRDRA